MEYNWGGESSIKSELNVGGPANDLAALSPDSNTDYSSDGHSHHNQLYTVVLPPDFYHACV